MRKLIAIAVFMMGLTLSMSAQTNMQVDPVAVQKATDEQVALYKLDANQAKEMYKIQERRLRNLQEIETLKEQNYDLYLAKRKAARTGTEGSIKRLLTPEQRPILEAQQMERRKQEGEKIQSMRAAGASKEEIQKAILEMGS